MTKPRSLSIYRGRPPLPEDAILSRFAIVGMSGSGKTQTARKLAEAMMDLGQHIGVLDPMGVWWGLRSSADGSKPGYPIVVFGGANGDAPIDPNSGKALAAAFMKMRFNAIFNMRGLSPVDVRRFSTDFLNEVNAHNEHPVHLFLDEFDIICPQAKSKYSEESREACNSTIRRGRSQGIGSTMITQNPQDVDKSVLNQADHVVAMRTQGAHPVEALKNWMGRNLPAEKLTELVSTLGELKTGNGWFWSPQNKIFGVKHFLLCKTFDSSKTPKLGETVLAPKVLAQVDLERLGAEIAASIERVRQESPDFLKNRIAELEAIPKGKGSGDGKAGTTTAPAPVDRTEIIRWQTRAEELEARLRSGQAAEEQFREQLRQLFEQMAGTLDLLSGLLKQPEEPEIQSGPAAAAAKAGTVENTESASAEEGVPDKGAEAKLTNDAPKDSETRLRGKSMDMLAACATFHPGGLTEARVAMQAGLQRTGGTFKTYKSLLATSGCVEIRDGLWYATVEGLRRAGADNTKTPITTEEMLAVWEPKLRGKARDMLRHLVARGGREVSYGDLAEVVGISAAGGTFKTYLSLLKTSGLITTGSGAARANADVLFL